MDLIGPDGKWNEGRVRQFVTEGDADLLLQILIPYTRTDDRFLWPHSKTGDLQARSVYHRLCETQGSDAGPSRASNTGLWNAIWGASIILKAKNYAWGLAANAIAVKSNLIRRGVAANPGCPICDEPETREHMTVECRWTQEIWETILGTTQGGEGMTNIKTWLEEQSRTRTGTSTTNGPRWEGTLITSWHIWKSRCKAEFEGVMPVA